MGKAYYTSIVNKYGLDTAPFITSIFFHHPTGFFLSILFLMFFTLLVISTCYLRMLDSQISAEQLRQLYSFFGSYYIQLRMSGNSETSAFRPIGFCLGRCKGKNRRLAMEIQSFQTTQRAERLLPRNLLIYTKKRLKHYFQPSEYLAGPSEERAECFTDVDLSDTLLGSVGDQSE